MRTYIEGCIDRAMTACLAPSDFNKTKKLTPGYPICLMGFVDKRVVHSLHHSLTVDDLPRITMSETSLWPYYPFIIHSEIEVNELGEFGCSVSRNIPSKNFHYRHGVVYHYESTIENIYEPLHDFAVGSRYSWFLPIRNFKPLILEELDYVLYKIIQDRTLFNYVMPGILRQLCLLGQYDIIWSESMMAMFGMLQKRCSAQQPKRLT